MEIPVTAVIPWNGARGRSGGVRVTPAGTRVAVAGAARERHSARARISQEFVPGI
jgi:hypothetical protein